MTHSVKSSVGEFSHSVEKNLLIIRERSWVDSADVSRVFVDDFLIDLVSFIVFKLDYFAVPSFLFDFFEDGDSVLSVSVRSFIRSSDRLEDADSFSLFYLVCCNFIPRFLSWFHNG